VLQPPLLFRVASQPSLGYHLTKQEAMVHQGIHT